MYIIFWSSLRDGFLFYTEKGNWIDNINSAHIFCKKPEKELIKKLQRTVDVGIVGYDEVKMNDEIQELYEKLCNYFYNNSKIEREEEIRQKLNEAEAWLEIEKQDYSLDKDYYREGEELKIYLTELVESCLGCEDHHD